jgi:hypothetical protein
MAPAAVAETLPGKNRHAMQHHRLLRPHHESRIPAVQEPWRQLGAYTPYPPDTRPRRKLSVVYFPVAPIKGFEQLREFYKSAPKESLQRISMNARIKTRVRFTRKPDDDDFDLLEVLAMSPT